MLPQVPLNPNATLDCAQRKPPSAAHAVRACTAVQFAALRQLADRHLIYESTT
jgi:hypothetical protein